MHLTRSGRQVRPPPRLPPPLQACGNLRQRLLTPPQRIRSRPNRHPLRDVSHRPQRRPQRKVSDRITGRPHTDPLPRHTQRTGDPGTTRMRRLVRIPSGGDSPHIQRPIGGQNVAGKPVPTSTDAASDMSPPPVAGPSCAGYRTYSKRMWVSASRVRIASETSDPPDGAHVPSHQHSVITADPSAAAVPASTSSPHTTRSPARTRSAECTRAPDTTRHSTPTPTPETSTAT